MCGVRTAGSWGHMIAFASSHQYPEHTNERRCQVRVLMGGWQLPPQEERIALEQEEEEEEEQPKLIARAYESLRQVRDAQQSVCYTPLLRANGIDSFGRCGCMHHVLWKYRMCSIDCKLCMQWPAAPRWHQVQTCPCTRPSMSMRLPLLTAGTPHQLSAWAPHQAESAAKSACMRAGAGVRPLHPRTLRALPGPVPLPARAPQARLRHRRQVAGAAAAAPARPAALPDAARAALPGPRRAGACLCFRVYDVGFGVQGLGSPSDRLPGSFGGAPSLHCYNAQGACVCCAARQQCPGCPP